MDSILQTDDTDPTVTHRVTDNTENESKILDQDQQQQVIDNLQKEFEHMQKTQKYAFYVFTILISAIASLVAFNTKNYTIFLPASASYLSLTLAQLLLSLNRNLMKDDLAKSMWIFLMSLNVELMSLFCSYKYGIRIGAHKPIVFIGIHSVYLALAAYLFSSFRFFRTFPTEIHNLEKLKYGPKML